MDAAFTVMLARQKSSGRDAAVPVWLWAVPLLVVRNALVVALFVVAARHAWRATGTLAPAAEPDRARAITSAEPSV